MVDIEQLNPQFITDQNGERTSVVLSVSKLQELMDDLEDLAAIAERREEPLISHADLIKELKNSGLL